MREVPVHSAGIWGCAAAEAFVVEAAFPSGVVRQGDRDFGIVSRCRQPGQAGRAGDVLPALLSCMVALQHPGGVGCWSVPR